MIKRRMKTAKEIGIGYGHYPLHWNSEMDYLCGVEFDTYDFEPSNRYADFPFKVPRANDEDCFWYISKDWIVEYEVIEDVIQF